MAKYRWKYKHHESSKATDEELFASMCLSKAAHRSNSDAMIAISKIRNRKGIHPYRCTFCGFWHIGNGPSETK